MRITTTIPAERTRRAGRATPSPRPATATTATAAVPAFSLATLAVEAPASASATDRLRIGAPADAQEQEADRLADAALRGPQAAPRRCPCGGMVEGGGECAACRAKRLARLRRTPAAASARAGDAPAIVHDVLREPGRPLDPATRADLEPRLGHDLGHIRVHTDARAAASARAVQALAYNVADHVVFAAGRYDPASTAGRRLLAHELVHATHQNDSPATREPVLRRKLEVLEPSKNIPNPGGKGRVITNRQQILEYIETLCDSPLAGISIGAGGQVTSTLCDDATLIPGVIDRTVHGCMCLCDVINNTHRITITVDDTTGPHTSMGPGAVQPGGTDADIVVWSDNATRAIGAPTVSGKLLDVPQWLALGHEMCGHAWLGMQGREDPGPKWTGLPGHVPATERENLIRREHDIEARAIWREPFCGEGFVFEKSKGRPATPAAVKAGSPDWLTNCTEWRNSLNWLNCTNYKLSDTIPEKVPNLCPRDAMRA